MKCTPLTQNAHPKITLHTLTSKGGAFVLKLGLVPRKTDLFRQVGFSVIFALRRVILLRSDIRFASFGGEYHITETIGFNITFATQKYHCAKGTISLNICSSSNT